jgi:hypothetical protein
VIDELETGSAGLAGPHVRQLVERGEADALSTYPRDLATGERLKVCCIRTPGHPPPHDVLDPFARIAG